MATRTVSTKLAIQGEEQYKSSIKTINSTLATLKSELKLTESQFAGQANSLEALEAKGETLSKMYEEQEKKLKTLNEVVSKARDIQQAYADRVERAQENVSKCKEALDSLANETGDTSAEQEKLEAALKAANDELAEAQKHYDEATRKTNSYQSQLNSTETALNALGREIDDNNRYLDEARSSTDGCAESIDEYGKEVKDASKETDSFGEKLKGGLVTGAKAAATALAAVGAAAVAGVGVLLSLAESTEEYRAAQGRLNTAFTAAGYSTDTATEAYRSLYAVLGDTDTATEAAQLLAQLATSEKDVATWGDIAAGVSGTFGDALPINSLIEAANETAKVGTVTGALADALNWVGISEDEFNEKLAACADETERANLITETLSSTYQNAGEIFKENNATLIEAREAQAELDDTLANLGETVDNVKNELVAEFAPALADVVDAFVDVINGVDGAEEALGEAIDGMIGQAADKLPELLEFGTTIILNILEGIVGAAPQLAEAAISVLTTLTEGLVSALPQLAEAAIQIVNGLATGIAEALPALIPAAVAALTQLVQTLIENIPLLIDAALQLVTGLATGIIEAIPVLLEALPTLIESLITALLEAVPQIIETGVTLLTALVTNLPDIIATICEVLPQIIESTINTLLSHLPEIVEAGVELLTALITNLPQIISTIVQALPQIITSIVSALVNNIPKIVETGVKLLTSLITNLPQIISSLVAAMPQIISSMVSALGQGVSAFAQVGVNLVQGLWSGIQSLAGWLWDKVSGWISSIWDGICGFFGISSPSKKMAWVSEMNIEGAARGIEQNKGRAVKAYGDMTAEMLDEVESGMGKVNTALADGIGEMETGFSARATIEQVSAAVPSMADRRGGSETASGGTTTVTNTFHIGELVVREEADVKRVAKELYNMQRAKTRGKGVVTS